MAFVLALVFLVAVIALSRFFDPVSKGKPAEMPLPPVPAMLVVSDFAQGQDQISVQVEPAKGLAPLGALTVTENGGDTCIYWDGAPVLAVPGITGLDIGLRPGTWDDALIDETGAEVDEALLDVVLNVVPRARAAIVPRRPARQSVLMAPAQRPKRPSYKGS